MEQNKRKEYIMQGLIEIGNCKNMEEAASIVEKMGFDNVIIDEVTAIQLYGDALWAAIAGATLVARGIWLYG